MKWLPILLLTALMACQHNPFKKDNEEQDTEQTELLDKAKTRFNFYENLEAEYTDSNGFVPDGGDTLFATCLHRAAGGNVDIFKARDPDGRWWRTVERNTLANHLWNEEHKDEIARGELERRSPASRSTISRDPILACSLVWLITQDLTAVESILDYSDANGGTLGESDGTISGKNRIKMTPTLKATLCEMRFRLGGKNDEACRKVPQVWGAGPGSDAHLEVLHILIRGKMFGAINDYTLSVLKKHAERQPDNAWFLAVKAKFTDGNQVPALKRILNPSHFPPDRLPNTADRCNHHLYIHEMTPDNAGPCPKGNGEEVNHPTVDYRIVYKVASGEI